MTEEKVAALEPKEESGGLDREVLQQGLAEQRLRGRKKLLGEVLRSLDLIKGGSALHKQTSAN